MQKVVAQSLPNESCPEVPYNRVTTQISGNERSSAEMILSTFISNQLTPAGSFTEDTVQRPTVDSRTPDHTSCRLQIGRVVREIESPEVRKIVDAVFKDLLRLLECLSLIESHLRQADAAEETFALFQIIHDEARVLVDYIRDDGLNCAAMSEDLVDILDGITFAVNHDLQRVFESEQRAATSPPTSHAMVGKLYRAHDLLTNCLQQSTITLAMVVDPEMEGSKLFNNSDIRYRQSLQLCEDLAALSQLLDTCGNTLDECSLMNLSAGIEKFRNESLECLMYSDWPQFENFCERINVAGTSWLDLDPVLHQFRCYVETLFGQVRMRAVLANVFPIQFGADNAAQTQDEHPAWDPFAVAV